MFDQFGVRQALQASHAVIHDRDVVVVVATCDWRPVFAGRCDSNYVGVPVVWGGECPGGCPALRYGAAAVLIKARLRVTGAGCDSGVAEATLPSLHRRRTGDSPATDRPSASRPPATLARGLIGVEKGVSSIWPVPGWTWGIYIPGRTGRLPRTRTTFQPVSYNRSLCRQSAEKIYKIQTEDG